MRIRLPGCRLENETCTRLWAEDGSAGFCAERFEVSQVS